LREEFRLMGSLRPARLGGIGPIAGTPRTAVSIARVHESTPSAQRRGFGALGELPAGVGEDDLHTAVLQPSGLGCVRGYGCVLAAPEGTNTICRDAARFELCGHGLSAPLRQLLVVL